MERQRKEGIDEKNLTIDDIVKAVRPQGRWVWQPPCVQITGHVLSIYMLPCRALVPDSVKAELLAGQ